jgi:2-polyprenyl-3-methyl-5-hydroxy-6-metoxy-1,4-benzoquinol methylase
VAGGRWQVANLPMIQRSYTKELLDEDDIPFEHIKKNMQELETINTLLGGHSITLKGLKALLGNRRQIHICEVGCGGGDNIKALIRWCRSENVDARFTGIDIKDTCIEYAKENLAGHHNIQWIRSDYKDVHFDYKPDIIFSSLFCHHFTDDELAEIISWKNNNSTIGFFINDLHRNTIAYHAIKLLTRIFSSSYLVQHDAPISVQRGFSKHDWIAIFDKTGVEPKISWEWAFRWLITVKK